MTTTCEQLSADRLAAWVEGASPEDASAQVAAHVATCPQCAAAAARLRAYRERLAEFRAATTPASLPVGFWERVESELGRVEERPTTDDRRPTTDDQPRIPIRARNTTTRSRSTVHGPRSTVHRRGWQLAFVTLIAAVAVAAGLYFRSGVELDAKRMMGRPIPQRLAFATPDPDHAARWMSGRLGVEIPPVNLSLLGGRLVGVDAEPRIQQGELLFRDARGTPILLYVFLHRDIRLPGIAEARHDGARYRVAEQSSPRRSIVVWQAEGRTFAAVSPLPPSDLLPFAHEMDRHCRRR